MVKTQYKLSTGLGKSLKNTAIVIGVPMLIFLADNWTQWMPDKYNAVALPIFGFIAYMIKNYWQNK